MKALRGLVAAILVAPVAAVAFAALAVAGPASPASAENNGVGLTPLMGWSSWSFIRQHPTASNIEASADALVSSGLQDVGYHNINIDDFYYICPGSQGPAVDDYGRWVTDTSKFPAGPNGENGIAVVADYVHSLGLNFGIYVTPGISKQAVAQNTPIEGTSYHADDIATTAGRSNYNCGGMVGIDYSKPGAQEFINSWANEFASWGVDYVKLDGVGTGDIPDVQAWSQALNQTGRPIHLELSNSLAIGAASTWEQLANGWRTGGDVECYCGSTSYPLTDWNNVSGRFNQVAQWAPYGGPGGFNDYDSIEVGNGANDGLTYDERKTQLSLWSLAASPLILGTDLTNLDPTDLALLKNTAVIAVDQDAIDATRIANSSTAQTFAKTEANGDVVVGLFNTGATTQTLSTSAAALGLPASPAYEVDDLWAGTASEVTGTVSEIVPSHGVALLRVSPLADPSQVQPNTAITVSGLGSLVGGTPQDVTVSFVDNGAEGVTQAKLGLSVPAGWSVNPSGQVNVGDVAAGSTASATFTVNAPAPSTLFDTEQVTASAAYQWNAQALSQSLAQAVTISPPVTAPYLTYSSATDAPAAYAESGQEFGVSGAGADLYSGTDAYTTVYLPSAIGDVATIDTEVASQTNLTGFGKTGIIVRNSMTGSGTTPEGVILFASPSGGIQLEWDNNGGTHINSVTPSNGTIPSTTPVYLKLERTSANSYTGYYSLDGLGWTRVGSATVPGQADTQDVGLFVTSHASGSPASAVFDGFSVAAKATLPPPGPQSYEAEAPANIIAGGARLASCAACSGGEKVGFVGNGGTLTFTGITETTTGTYPVTLVYLDGEGRQATISANGGTGQTLTFTPTGSFDTIGTVTIQVPLNAGSNTIEISNPSAYAPDFDRILVSQTPGGWSSSAVYVAGDKVTYQSSIWQALWWTKDQAPGDPNGPWEEFAVALDGNDLWTPTRVFDAGDVAEYQGAMYQALWWTRNQAPGDPNGPWEQIATAPDGTALWTPSRIFDAGDVAEYQGVVYQARWWTRDETPGDPNGPWVQVPTS